MSRSRLSRTTLSPKATVMSRAESTIVASPAAAGSSIPLDVARSFTIATLELDRRVEDGEHAIENDDDEDRLHHRGGDVHAERLGAAADLQAFDGSR